MNNVILIGRLTRDIELRFTTGEDPKAVVKFNIAVDRVGKENEADFPSITVFGRQAENCEKYLSKGSMVGVQGKLRTGSYTDKEGKTKYTTEVIADRIEFLSFNKKEEVAEETPQQIPEFKSISEDVPF